MPQPGHDARILQIESDAEHILLTNPQNYQDIFKDLQTLKQSESSKQFAKDLEAINLRLHEDGWLPTMEIAAAPKGGFMLRRLNTADWERENQQQVQQYNNKNFGAPPPVASPTGYDSGYNPKGGASHKGGYAPRATYNPSSKGSSGRFKYNPDVSGDAAQRILAQAHNSIGQQMWRHCNRGASGAAEGCAASVSAVLQEAGVSKVNQMGCRNLQAALIKEGWTVTNTPSPGDVVFGYGGLSKAHVGIVDVNGKVMDNHSNTGQFSSDSLSYFSNWHQTVFLHPPQTTDTTAQAVAPAQHVAAVSTPTSAG